MTDEIVDTVTSEEPVIENMLDQLEDIKEEKTVENPKNYSPECKGNIFSDCIIRGLEDFGELAEDANLEYTIIGGIGTQLKGLKNSRSLRVIADNLARRETADIDILVKDRGDGLEVLRNYDTRGKPDIDIISSHIPWSEQIIKDSEPVYFGDVHEDYDFQVRLPTDEDLVFTKIWYPPLRHKEGTRYDLEIIAKLEGKGEAELEAYELDHEKLRKKIYERSEDPEFSLNYLKDVGIDI